MSVSFLLSAVPDQTLCWALQTLPGQPKATEQQPRAHDLILLLCPDLTADHKAIIKLMNFVMLTYPQLYDKGLNYPKKKKIPN